MVFWIWTAYLFLFTGHVAYMDIRTRSIPNTLLGGYGSGMLVLAGCAPDVGAHWLSIASATLLVMVIGFAVYAISSSAIGGGDIKYMIVLSIALGGSGTLLVFLCACVLATIAIVIRWLMWRIRFGESIALAPYLSICAMLIWLWPVLQS